MTFYFSLRLKGPAGEVAASVKDNKGEDVCIIADDAIDALIEALPILRQSFGKGGMIQVIGVQVNAIQ